MESNNINHLPELQKKVLLMKAQKDFLQLELKRLEKEVQSSKNWIEKQPKLLSFLQQLQSIIYQQNIGMFSALLSELVKEILQKDDKKIDLELYTYHNLPALKIEAINKGFPESILEGSGGSLANIVSTGLRLIALSKLPHRKFIILDEADCWLEPDRIPLFARVLGEISLKMNIQIIVISHHKPEYFKDYGRVVMLEKKGGMIESSIIHDLEIQPEQENNYLKSLNLKNFMSHKDTTIEFHPNITCIIGKNDIGKSAILSAFKSLCYGDSSDTYIRHSENQSLLSLAFDGNKIINWTRILKKTEEQPQKVKYELWNSGIETNSQYSSQDAPDFVKKELNIMKAEDIDIHIGNQKEPVFLIDSKTKPHEKAKILALGKESILIQKLMEKIKERTKEHKSVIKFGELNYANVQAQLVLMEEVEKWIEEVDSLKSDADYIIKEDQVLDSIIEHFEELERLDYIANTKLLNYELSKLQLEDTTEMEQALHKFKAYSAIAHIKFLDANISTIKEENVDEMKRMLSQYKKIKSLADLDLIDHELKKFNLENAIRDAMLLDETIQKKVDVENTLLDLDTKQKSLEKWKKTLHDQLHDLLEKEGNVCSECGQSVKVENFIKFD